jgi:hypothetical protein
MQGLPVGWTDVGITRRARLRCLGNAVVPRQAVAALSLLCGDTLRAAA